MSLPLPAQASRAMIQLGADISLARRRRCLTQATLAQRGGIGLNTLRRLERGDPKVALEYVARVLHVLGEIERLEKLLDTRTDDAGLAMMNERLPERVRCATPVTVPRRQKL